MKRSAIAFALILSLLSLAAVGFHGCGKKNTITSITVTACGPVHRQGNDAEAFRYRSFFRRDVIDLMDPGDVAVIGH